MKTTLELQTLSKGKTGIDMHYGRPLFLFTDESDVSVSQHQVTYKVAEDLCRMVVINMINKMLYCIDIEKNIYVFAYVYDNAGFILTVEIK